MTGKNFILSKKFITLPLVFIFLAVPTMARMNQATNDYIQGRMEGERDAKGNPAWIAGGVLCGCIAVLYVYAILKPAPPATALVGKNQDYILGYSEGYQKKTRSKNGMYALLGWAASLLIVSAAGGLSTAE